MLTWDLEDWITDEGAQVLDKRIQSSPLTANEELLYQIWLLDTEARNGGISQYFCNHGKEQWQTCQRQAATCGLTSFIKFSTEVNAILKDAEDPYTAIRANGIDTEDLWFLHQSTIVKELKALYQNAQ